MICLSMMFFYISGAKVMKRNEFKHTCQRQETDFKEFYYFQDDLICTQRHKDTKFLLSELPVTKNKNRGEPW
jgi:hypothetical protein